MTTTELTCRSGLHPLTVGKDSRGGCRACSEDARMARDETRVERLKRLLMEARPPERNWQVRALCNGADPTDWSYEEGARASTRATALEFEELNLSRHKRAKVVCGFCPVRKSCLDSQLLGNGEPTGTWGGEYFTSTDRDPLRAARKELGL